MNERLNHNDSLFEKYSRKLQSWGMEAFLIKTKTPKANKKEKDKSDYKKSLTFVWQGILQTKTDWKNYICNRLQSYYRIQWGLMKTDKTNPKEKWPKDGKTGKYPKESW